MQLAAPAPQSPRPGSWEALDAMMAKSAAKIPAMIRQIDIDGVKQGARNRNRYILARYALVYTGLHTELEAYEIARTIKRDDLIEMCSGALQAFSRRTRQYGFNRSRSLDLSVVRQCYVAERLARFRDRATAREMRGVA